MEPIVHGLEAEYGNEIQFIYVDIDDPASQTYKDQYGFRVQPHFFLIGEDGEVISQWFGLNEGAVFANAFNDVLN